MKVEQTIAPPVAKAEPVITTIHGEERIDAYGWLKDRGDPEVVAYLESENAYTERVMAHTKGVQEALYAEMLARIKETDMSVPMRRDDWWYYTRTEEGKQYSIHCRRHGNLDAPEQVILDVNVLAEGHEHFQLGSAATSPDHRLYAYTTDTNGSELYHLYVKDLESGEVHDEGVTDVEYSLVWANDNRTLYYSVRNHAHRPYRLYRHVLGSDARDDVVVFEEPDDAFYLRASGTRTRRYIVVGSSSAVTSEWWVLDADDPVAAPRIVAPRAQGVEYYLDHHGDRFVIWTNDGAKNFRVVEAPCAAPGKENWREILPHRPDVKVEGVHMFRDHMVVTQRELGLRTIRIERISDGDVHSVDFPEPVYYVSGAGNIEFDTDQFRFNYTSLVAPNSVFDYDMDAHTRELRKQQEVTGGYDPSLYESERIWARAPDGVEVPISVVYRKGFPRDGSRPLWLYGYGSYGASMDPVFSSNRLSLLDRGFAYAIAHIRGGGELGEDWRDAGKLDRKMNTFTDFIACAEHLVAGGWTSPERLVINGGSAGGLLMGAVVNLRPDLFEAAIAEVPFVDVVNTILDPNLLFSVMEYEEWGNPNEPEAYRTIMRYSPYDNVEARAYPHMLVTAGFHDPRVNYWEPAKWVARLRALATDSHRLLLRTKMVAGHAGASGRYDRLRDEAFKLAFALDVLGITS